uniref:Helicase ATP-binding domain-containing protein n=1 Tax=Parascaris equorum TaxID=6256 RepID=A0A914RI78_PAREQ
MVMDMDVICSGSEGQRLTGMIQIGGEMHTHVFSVAVWWFWLQTRVQARARSCLNTSQSTKSFPAISACSLTGVMLARHVSVELKSSRLSAAACVDSTVPVDPNAKVVFMTAKRLLVELVTNPDLRDFGCVIMDEAHERTIDGDLCLGMIKEILHRRENLKLGTVVAELRNFEYTDVHCIAPLQRLISGTFGVMQKFA